MRRAARRDETEAPIVKGLRSMGYQVQLQNFPDLLVRNPRDGVLTILEVDGITKNRKREKQQLEFLRDWQVPLVKTLEDALRALGSRIL